MASARIKVVALFMMTPPSVDECAELREERTTPSCWNRPEDAASRRAEFPEKRSDAGGEAASGGIVAVLSGKP